MAAIDYSKFEKLALEQEEEERREKEAQPKPNVISKYVDSDGETVSGGESESESDSDDDDDEELHPLFWNKMPKQGSKREGMAKVLDDLVYKNDDDEDKTPNELAIDFKDKGNDYYKWGRKYYKKALKEYKQALQYAREGDGSDENKLCYASILANRAAINLKMRNFGSVVRDCKAAIKYGPSPLPNCKPYFRAATASIELGKHKDAKKFIDQGLKLDADNKEMRELKEKVEKKLKEQRKAQMKIERERLAERKKDEVMRKACVALGIVVGPLVNDIAQFTQSAVGNLTGGGFPRPGLENDSMQWPVMVMYPESMQSEYIMSFDLEHTFRMHLEQMFPETAAECQPGNPQLAPWDTEGAYSLDSIEIYFEERYVQPFKMDKMWAAQYGKVSQKDDFKKRCRVRVKLDTSLKKCLQDSQYVVPGIPTFYVVSNRSSKYYNDVFVPQHKGRLRIL
mmetsp:Transcript_5221/g.7981  ORF Transcript_5221/g.7981 Transcript_5221/m.7981 type:complete len:453 (+) Transcript_5221:73-1431(+)|eukprot:CAMPEP_0203745848 /NCGR_PEP_ID=MMETSP0098-20131031/1468_1 /ASSEMBLY_ACC=CAM_ASM_000208 /TAXON_ID=96639 /ORGANISM=" , Strain NY0313808BC1" /LENGTH=452 /DNA_ID=CAMNT_0050633755 /DNA_START=407 /DNA_END=1765 /DNA_ORIENTATION=-